MAANPSSKFPCSSSMPSSTSLGEQVLSHAQSGREVIQDFVPLAESLEWELGQQYLRERGSAAFISDASPIPFVINNDGTLSRNAAEVFFASLIEADKTILLWCEQGLGDTLQFVRYASRLKELGATVWLECPPKMIPLLSTCWGVDRVLPEGTPLPPGFDCQTPLMSLPHLFGTTLSDVPAGTPYLSTDAAQVDRWNTELSGSPHFKIGVAWQGNPKHRFDQHRSFSIHWFRSLATLEGVELYSLQKGPGSEQLQTVRFPIIDLGSKLDETGGAFQETAAVMQALDLVITCDSSLAHLAGALGVPVWVPLSIPADWRWMRDRDATPWYPTMRLFRQTKLGQWSPVFERMCQEIGTMREPASSAIRVEVAPGELLDKLTILQIKSERITDQEKLRSVRCELALVEATRRQTIRELPELLELVRELKEVNERLWDIENRIRDCEKAGDFGSDFIGLARSVYQTNDRRAAIKRQLNELLGAKFREEKDYHAY